MTPMVDVVFLLIIFFLVSSHLARQEHFLPLQLPHSRTFQQEHELPGVLTVQLASDGQLQLRGNAVRLEQLPDWLQRHQRQHGDQATVRIRTAESTPYGFVEPILRFSAQYEIDKVFLAVYDIP